MTKLEINRCEQIVINTINEINEMRGEKVIKNMLSYASGVHLTLTMIGYKSEKFEQLSKLIQK